MMNRRTFLKSAPALGLTGITMINPTKLFSNQTSAKHIASGHSNNLFEISISQWCYHRAIFGDSRTDYAWFLKTLANDPDAVLQGGMDPRDIVLRARELDIDIVDLVNILFYGHADDQPWLNEFLRKSNGEGVRCEMLMLDETGSIGASSSSARKQSIDQVRIWMECAVKLKCHSIRVNAYGDGSYLDQLNRSAESLNILGQLGNQYNLDVLVENHGHPASPHIS